MPALDERGKMAAAQIAFYVPIAIISLLFFVRYLFSNDGGWFLLLIFALSESCLLRENDYILVNEIQLEL